MVVTLVQQYNVGGKPTVMLYTYINRHAGTPDKNNFYRFYLSILPEEKLYKINLTMASLILLNPFYFIYQVIVFCHNWVVEANVFRCKVLLPFFLVFTCTKYLLLSTLKTVRKLTTLPTCIFYNRLRFTNI